MKKTELIEYANERSVDTSFHFTSYDNYIEWQCKTGCSFESDSERWSTGQEKYIDRMFNSLDRELSILDVCAGDGVGLRYLRKLGFTSVLGVEVNDEKIKRATDSNCCVIKHDICCSPFSEDYEDSFDIVYSSHTLEHVLNPEYTIRNLYRLLKKSGKLLVVLPYPDYASGSTQTKHSFMVHCGGVPLKLNIGDSGESTVKIFEDIGFKLVCKEFDHYREPEIWLTFQK
jgi:2-polyprenyl-3-methyl-5-hydroxy-6-metoxy-1,4-benzoquinol methylase